MSAQNKGQVASPLRLGIAGLGTVGIGTVKIIQKHAELLSLRAGRPIVVTAVSARELQQEPFVAFTCATDGMGLEPMVMLREGAGLGRRISGSSHNLEEVRRMIVSGLGIGLLPAMAVAEEVASGKLWPLRFTNQPLGADVFLIRHADSPPSIPEAKFIAMLDELRGLYPDMC